MKILKHIAFGCLLILGVWITGCSAVVSENSDVIKASGVVEATEINVATEVSGRVVEVLANQGDKIQVGDVLFVLENELLAAQSDQAEAALEAARANMSVMDANVASAEAGVEAARLGLEIARLQSETVLRSVRLGDLPVRAGSWNGDTPDEFDLPSWYFGKDEEIQTAEQEVSALQSNLETEKANLTDVLNDVSNADIRVVEARLASAQYSFKLVSDLVDREVEQNGEAAISDYLQSLYDSAEAELRGAQTEYDSILSDQGAQDLLEARARVSVAEERYQLGLARLYQLQTGDNSIEVAIADLSVQRAQALLTQAESALTQAQTAVQQAGKLVDQAQANLEMFSLQIDKLTVYSRVSGVVMVKTIEAGELLQPGVTAMTIGQLDDLKITVYVPEEIYGRIRLGDSAEVRVDSFEGKVFSAVVTKIADQAEYTPRNVQTEEDRRTTVFAIELSVSDSQGQLKPGMPADVSFVK